MSSGTRALLQATAERAAQYLEGIGERSVIPTQEAVASLRRLDEPLPDQPSDPAKVLALLDEVGSPATLASAGPRYYGFVTGGTLPAALAASWLATAWDNNAGLTAMSPIAAKAEEVALRWLVDLLGLPAGAGGGFVTGATAANFTGLAAARHALLAQQDWDVEAFGLFGAPPLTVVVSDEVHVSLLKALSLLGLGRERVVRVPVDNQGRLRVNCLPRLDERTILCLQAGNVNTGASDPLAEACSIARRVGAWVHVDGAFGLWAATSPHLTPLVAGLAEADSWATDAHKWLNTPYDSGLVFCREASHLRGAMSTSAAYLMQGDAREPCHYTPEMSRRARGIEVWAALRSLGRRGLADLVERNVYFARQLADGLAANGCEILNEVVLNQVLVRFGDDECTRRVVAAVQREGTCWCGGTVWQGRAAMRISISSWATTAADVERSQAAILRMALQEGASGIVAASTE
jgi:glutamate/tyrosine decarboxylase-like PLP-dependent enzyme